MQEKLNQLITTTHLGVSVTASKEAHLLAICKDHQSHTSKKGPSIILLKQRIEYLSCSTAYNVTASRIVKAKFSNGIQNKKSNSFRQLIQDAADALTIDLGTFDCPEKKDQVQPPIQSARCTFM